MHIALLTANTRPDAAEPPRRRGSAAWAEWPGVCVILKGAIQAQEDGRRDLRFTIAGSAALVHRLQPELLRMGLGTVRAVVATNVESTFDLLTDSDACLWHSANAQRVEERLPEEILPALALEVPVILGARGRAVDDLLNRDAGLAMIPDVADSLLDAVDELCEFPHACRNGRASLAADPRFARHPLVAMAERIRRRTRDDLDVALPRRDAA